MRFEYLVCMSQRGKVTHANAEWTGAGDPADLDAKELEAALGSCPDEEEYLNRVGQDGWELVAVNSTVTGGEIVTGLISNDEFEISGYRTLFLKRPL